MDDMEWDLIIIIRISNYMDNPECGNWDNLIGSNTWFGLEKVIAGKTFTGKCN